MRHIDTETILRTATQLADLAAATETIASKKLSRTHDDWSTLWDLLSQVRAFHSAIAYLRDMPEPASLAAAFRKPRKTRPRRRRSKKTLVQPATI